jgi:steroid delta-isomerase-like uncharacterized protein
MMKRRHMFTAASAFGLSVFLAAPIQAADPAATVVENYLAAWNAHDAAKAASYFADDVSYFDASVGKPVVGKDAAKTGVIDNFINAAPDLVWEMKGEPLVSGDRVAFEWKFSGINKGAWADGTAATNKPFAFDGASLFEIKDGLIVHQADYYDALGFYKQLGLM